jgi:aminoglycoside/choline kinase family phosphotransferase
MVAAMIPPAAAPEFLAAHGWGGADIVPLAGDASFRRYFRVRLGQRQAVLMDAPPPQEDPRPFIAMAEWLIGAGLSAPGILARDLDQGLLLIEDFGDVRLRETADSAPKREAELYIQVTDLLVHLHGCAPPTGLRPHGLTQWLDEVMLFTDWYCPTLGLDVDRDEWRAVWHDILAPVADDGLPQVTVLRDYHAENIMLLPHRSGPQALGLLDFQDALIGHPAYDLVSVLQDARRDVSPAVEQAMVARYRAATSGDARFDRAYWALAAQRNTRILGVFTRLWKRDNKPHYRSFQPRMWGLLERDLAQPGLETLHDWFARHVPADARAAAWQDAL